MLRIFQSSQACARPHDQSSCVHHASRSMRNIVSNMHRVFVCVCILVCDSATGVFGCEIVYTTHQVRFTLTLADVAAAVYWFQQRAAADSSAVLHTRGLMRRPVVQCSVLQQFGKVLRTFGSSGRIMQCEKLSQSRGENRMWDIRRKREYPVSGVFARIIHIPRFIFMIRRLQLQVFTCWGFHTNQLLRRAINHFASGRSACVCVCECLLAGEPGLIHFLRHRTGSGLIHWGEAGQARGGTHMGSASCPRPQAYRTHTHTRPHVCAD